MDSTHKVAWTSLNQSEFQASLATPQEVLDLNQDLLRYLNDTDVSLFFIEQTDSTLIQVRSNNPLISFEMLNQRLEGTGKNIHNGLDFQIDQKKIIEIEYDFLKLILDFQKERLHLDKNLHLKKVNVFSAPLLSSDHKPLIKKPNVHTAPKAPTVIPFELLERSPLEKNTPEMPHKSKASPAPKVSVPKESPTTSIKPKLPDWLQH